jgi:hypothetical protein
MTDISIVERTTTDISIASAAASAIIKKFKEQDRRIAELEKRIRYLEWRE